MASIPLFIRYSEMNISLNKVALLTQEGNLIYNDEGGDVKAHFKTAFKFALLTAASPLIVLAHLVRAAVFACKGEFNRSGREFVGAFAAPLLALGCMVGTLISALVHVISSGKNSFYVSMRRTHAKMEAWINQIDLNSPKLGSYSSRVSAPTEWLGNSKNHHIWTTAPCMQPLLENGDSNRGGLLDAARIQQMFQLISVKGMRKEGDRFVIQSEYQDENTSYQACGGAYEHRKISKECCCCFRIDVAVDRFLCCKLSQGSCSSMAHPGDACGYVSASTCGVGVCCCYTTQDQELISLQSGCFGPQGISCVVNYKRA